MALSDLAAKRAKPGEKRYQMADAEGLYLEVMPSGKKYWRLRYARDGKRSWRTIGEYPATSLAEAREKRGEIRKRLRGGGAIEEKSRAFRDVALEWADAHDCKISGEQNRKAVRRNIDDYLFPLLGSADISKITAADVLAALRPLMERKAFATAKQVRGIASQVFRYAAAQGLCAADPAAALRGALITPEAKHRASVKTPAEAGLLMRCVSAYPFPRARLLLRFSALTFCRPGEIRGAEWKEMTGAEWRIPAEKMKMRAVHVVPLSRQSLAVLEEAREYSGSSRYVFPGIGNRDSHVSEIVAPYALKVMGYDGETMTPHGFRSMASTLLNENGFHPDWIERQLAHSERNAVRAAYNYADYLPERRGMMQWWADYLDALERGELPPPRPASR